MTSILTLVAAVLGAGPTVGEPAPWFAGWTAAEQVVNRDHLLARPAQGHVVALFATWCAPCGDGLAALKAAALPGVRITAVACGQTPDVVQPWLKARGLTDLAVVYDRFGQIARDLGAERPAGDGRTLALPRVLVMDGDGIVRAVLDGDGAHDVAAIAAALRSAASPPGRPPGAAAPPPAPRTPAARGATAPPR